MKRITTLFIISFLLFNLSMISLEPLTITNPANALRYDKKTNLTYSDASFLGGGSWGGGLGKSIATGDVNGDGYDDILIGASSSKGIVYLIFGKGTGWSIDLNLSKTDASFIGEHSSDGASYVAIAGDVNSDGYEDILIGAPENDEGGRNAGQIYLILGKATGWSKNTSLSNANASFLGENPDEHVGNVLIGAGDVNGDGYDDIMIAARDNSESMSTAGQVYLIFGNSSGWSMDTNLSNSSASFLGECDSNQLGRYIAGVGDINKDGYDDILAYGYNRYVSDRYEKRAYLIYGKNSSWAMDTNISTADAMFYGCGPYAGAGDVNGDGIDDIIMRGENYLAGTAKGTTYLFFGQASRWSNGIHLSSANASFNGEKIWDTSGHKVGGGGDVNGDGYDDFYIMAWAETCDVPSNQRKNEIYIILGNASGWMINTSLSTADFSFTQETLLELPISCGDIISIEGDVNGDGFDDILIGAPWNDEGGMHAGQVYIIFPELDKGPNVVNSVKVYSNPSFIDEIDIAEIGDTIYVELIGTDENTSHIDNAAVSITSTSSSPEGFLLYLLETGFNTGKYRGSFRISDRTHKHLKLINATIGENVLISSVTDQTKNATILVTTFVQLGPQQDKTAATEDEEYFIHYWNFGYNLVSTWTFDTNATSWLYWDSENQNIYGTPNNGDVGTYWVRINITDGLGNFDEHNFTLTVQNTPPDITTEDLIIAKEDELYYMDYTSSDDGQGMITWNLETNASWLELESATGELSGIPTNDDRGIHKANVSVYDGNGGRDWSYFEITVVDTNDAPVIITENITTVFEDEYYFVQYNATDIDGEKIFRWYLETNASWLIINKDTGELSGTPNNDHVGSSYVNISVKDPRDSSDSQNFTLEVINVNDPPGWVTVPTDTKVNENDYFSFDVDAVDVDSGDLLVYGISSDPITEITIDQDSGLIEWTAPIVNLSTPQYIFEVEISVSDGTVMIQSYFEIEIVLNPISTTNLISPANNSIVSSFGTELTWTGYDETEEPITFDLYLSSTKSSVIKLAETARILHDTNTTSYFTEGLKIGRSYFWTVIPQDQLRSGTCLEGIFRFEINSPPELTIISKQKINFGEDFQLKIDADDKNAAQVWNLLFNLDSAPEGMVVDPTTGVITWIPTKDQLGSHKVNIWVSDGLDQTNITFEIEVIDEQTDKQSSNPTFIIISSFILILIIIVNMGIASTEVGKYKFLSLIFVPLYNKLHPDNILNNFLRGRIYGYISAKPGENYNAIKKALDLNNGTLAHHARVLEKERYIYSKRDGFYTRFYPKSTKIPDLDSPQLTEIQKNMIEIIRNQPGVTQHEIVPLLNASQPDISYNITKLSRENIINVERNGRENRYYLNYGRPKSNQNHDQAISPADKHPAIQSRQDPKEFPVKYSYPELPPSDSRTDQQTRHSIDLEFDKK